MYHAQTIKPNEFVTSVTSLEDSICKEDAAELFVGELARDEETFESVEFVGGQTVATWFEAAEKQNLVDGLTDSRR